MRDPARSIESNAALRAEGEPIASRLETTSFSSRSRLSERRSEVTLKADKEFWLQVPEHPERAFLARINPEGEIGVNVRRLRTLDGKPAVRARLKEGTVLDKVGDSCYIRPDTECTLVDGTVTFPGLRPRRFTGLYLPIVIAQELEVLKPQDRVTASNC